jgi:hypothetical protein
MKVRITVVAAVAFFAILVAEPALAQKVTQSGRALYTPVATESQELPDGRTVKHVTASGFSIVDNSQDPPVNETCSGTRITAADGESWSENGYCFNFDPDGDAVWLWYKNTDAGGEYHFIAGTGKFEGITGGGTSRVGFEWEDGKFFVLWEETWEAP